MGAGIIAGRLLRRHPITWLGKVINILIWLLLFLLGVEVGGDDRIVEGIATLGAEAVGIATLGAEAVGIAFAGVAGSALLASGLWIGAGKRKKGGDTK